MPASPRESRIFLTGTDEAPAPARRIEAGSTSATIVEGAVRAVFSGELELVRQIDFPVRDANWASLTPKIVRESLDETSDGWRYHRDFEVADGALVCRVTYHLSEGAIVAEGEAEARRDFTTSRTGFTVLHRCEGFAGAPVTVRHAAGGEVLEDLPALISPGQPVKDIAGLTFALDGVSLDIAFSGEVFEMEDQRNWSDASFKTYGRPLAEPFPYTIRAGEKVRQSVRIVMSGQPVRRPGSSTAALSLGPPLPTPLPRLLLAADEGWLAADDKLATLAHGALDGLLLRVTPASAASLFADARGHLAAAADHIDLEIVLADGEPAGPQLDAVAEACRACGVSPAHVIALPEAYLASHQPDGPWPSGLSPDVCVEAARRAFPDARIGAGMLTNFTELNRCRPDGSASDYVTHGNSATVHAADDASVMQTLETLPHILRSGRAIAGRRGYRLGLTAIGMRTNPYGKAITPNPDQQRLTMTRWDPRARALFGAAWAVAVLAATAEVNVEAIALAAPAGPFGILSAPGEVPRAWFDDHPEAEVYPIFHVLRALAGGPERLSVSGLPDTLAAVATRIGSARRLVVSNLTGAPQTLTLPEMSTGAVLDQDRFVEAACDPLWLDHAARPLPAGPVTLPPYAVFFSTIAEA